MESRRTVTAPLTSTSATAARTRIDRAAPRRDAMALIAAGNTTSAPTVRRRGATRTSTTI